MIKIQKPDLIFQLLNRYPEMNHVFTTPIEIEAFSFSKGELIISPLKPLKYIFFLLEGQLNIYTLKKDGSTSPVGILIGSGLLGDIEFVHPQAKSLFVEAKTDGLFLGISLSKYRAILKENTKFLFLILHSLTDKIEKITDNEVQASSIEERVLNYLDYLSPTHEIRGIEQTAMQIRCSRRQLLRVLKSLCDKNIMIKTGKGCYKRL